MKNKRPNIKKCMSSVSNKTQNIQIKICTLNIKYIEF